MSLSIISMAYDSIWKANEITSLIRKIYYCLNLNDEPNNLFSLDFTLCFLCSLIKELQNLFRYIRELPFLYHAATGFCQKTFHWPFKHYCFVLKL